MNEKYTQTISDPTGQRDVFTDDPNYGSSVTHDLCLVSHAHPAFVTQGKISPSIASASAKLAQHWAVCEKLSNSLPLGIHDSSWNRNSIEFRGASFALNASIRVNKWEYVLRIPAEREVLANGGLVFGQRLRRWPNTQPPFDLLLLFLVSFRVTSMYIQTERNALLLDVIDTLPFVFHASSINSNTGYDRLFKNYPGII